MAENLCDSVSKLQVEVCRSSVGVFISCIKAMEVDSNDPSVIYGSLKNFVVEEKKIGQGQFSIVHRAICKSDGRAVALKKIQVCFRLSTMILCLARSSP
jgi:hypothetical protein